MQKTLSNFQEQEYIKLDKTFQELLDAQKFVPEDMLFLTKDYFGGVLSYDEIVKLRNGQVAGRMMVCFINFIQSKSESKSKYFIGMLKNEIELIEPLNEVLRENQQEDDDFQSYTFILSWNKRWVCGIYYIKTQILEIVDLQMNKTKDQLKKSLEGVLKKVTGQQKTPIKTVTYVQQDDKLTDGGVYIFNYLYQVMYKGKAYVKLNPQEKIEFNKKVIWLFLKVESDQHVDYPVLPSIVDYKEAEIKAFKLQNIDPLITELYTGFEVKEADFTKLQKEGKSSFQMMAFWLSYIYYFDTLKDNPQLPYFVVAEGSEYKEDFELIFRTRRRPNSSHDKLVIVSLIKQRWIIGIYQINIKKVEIVDLQFKNITKEELQTTFDSAFSNLFEIYQVTPAVFITQTYTDNTDGTEFVVNFLFQYINNQTPLDKIKFGMFEKRQLRNKLLWVLIKMRDSPTKRSEASIKSQKKMPVRMDSQTSISLEPRFAKRQSNNRILSNGPTLILTPGGQGGQNTPKQKVSNSPTPIIEETKQPQTRSRFSNRFKKESEENVKDDNQSEMSETSIQVKKPTFNNIQLRKEGTILPKAGGLRSRGNTKPIIETNQNQEEDDEQDSEEEFQKIFPKQQQQRQSVDQLNRLDRIQQDLQDYYIELINEVQDEEEENIDKLTEINRLNDQIQKYLQRRNKIPIEEVLDNINVSQMKKNNKQYNSQLQNFSTVIHDDQSILRMLNDMLDVESTDDNINQSLMKRRNYVNSRVQEIDVTNPEHPGYNFPQLSQSLSLPSLKIKGLEKSEIMERSKLAAKRYGINIEIPMMQKFYKDAKMPHILMNFLLHFLQEKGNHKKSKGQYNWNVRFFPLEFYQILTYNNLHSTFKINYYEANSFTFEYTGKGETIFDLFEWIIVPIAEFAFEYSVVAVNLKKKECYCYLLSSLALRIKDPLYMNPEKNPYMKNVVNFVYYEYETKLRRPRDELGRFIYQFGRVNNTLNFGYQINYDFSGEYAIYIMIHILKRGHNQDINIADHESVVLKKALHDIVVRIGYNVDDNLFHLLEDSMWPF